MVYRAGNDEIRKEEPQVKGLDASRVQEAFRLIDAEIEKGEIPGATAIISHAGQSFAYAAGRACISEEGEFLVTQDTVYDCASLTKVVVTLPLVLHLVDRGLLHLNDPVARFFPRFAAHNKADVTVGQLLAHTSGLPATCDSQCWNLSPDELFAAICEVKLVSPPGTRMVYSCLGFIVLGRIVPLLLNAPLDRAADELIFRPLCMTSSRFNPPAEWLPRIAATEFDMDMGQYRWGRVHDETAYALGGVSGNAGLFSTASDLLAYARMWLSGGKSEVNRIKILSPDVVRLATICHTDNIPNARRGLGWVLKGDPRDASGDYMSAQCYGHNGFTGTSMLIDPVYDLIIILLTNRVHFGRDKSVDNLRSCFHNAVAAALIE